MNSPVSLTAVNGPLKRPGLTAALIAAVILLILMALDTKVVVIGSEADVREGEFASQQYGEEQFPEILAYVEDKAVAADTLASAIARDKTAAGKEYGAPGGIGPIMPVIFTGVVGEQKAGVYTVDVSELAGNVAVRVQTGPAINGTDLRDATGKIEFGQFTNQIEYQNAGAGINNAMKAEVLADIDTGNLSGKTVEITGVFQLINPKNWLVTPVRLRVK